MKNNINKNKLAPYFVTGFADAEGAFMVKIKETKSKLGWNVYLELSIDLHIWDVDLLQEIQVFFKGIGKLYFRDKSRRYSVRSLKDILTLIEHFDKYPLHTQKRGDYLLFKSVALLMKNKKHLDSQGLQQIINFKASINRGLSISLQEAFPNTIPIERQNTEVQSFPKDWLAGFVTGDGGFGVAVTKKNKNSHFYGLGLMFYVTQHVRDKQLIEAIQNFFDCGRIVSDRHYYNLNLRFKLYSY